MGVANTEESDCNVEMSTKPKERQFQVVPVPGVFTRGRWKCWDYREDPSLEEKILNFADKAEKLAPVDEEMEEPIVEVKKLYVLLFEPGSQTIRVYPGANEGSLTANAEPPSAVEALYRTVSDPQAIYDSPSGIILPSSGKESSTIVVTSIAPASVTPVHVSSPSAVVPISPEPLVASTTLHVPIISSTLTILSEGETSGISSLPLSPLGHCSTTTTINLGGSTSPQAGAPGNIINTAFASPSAASIASGHSCGSILSCPNTTTTSQVPRQMLSRETSAPQNAPSPVLSRQASLASFSDATVSSIPVLCQIDSVLEDP